MTKVRAEVVCEASLYEVASRHNFSDFLLVGKSERSCNGNKKMAVMADSVKPLLLQFILIQDWNKLKSL
ncbi:MAG: hypothetical protein V8R30_06240 [Clostridia bacterium]